MSARGFTLIELLVGMLLTLLIVAATLLLADSARTTLLVEPARIDVVRRTRESAEGLAGVLRAAGGAGVGEATRPGTLAALVPHVWPLPPMEDAGASRYGALWVLTTIDRTAARVAADQPGPGGSLTLDPAPPCPATPVVCGLAVNDVVMVIDARGRFDIFEVGAVWPSLMRITPAAPLSRAYRPGAWVVKVRADRYGLTGQPDGSQALTRITWAGARQPLVDGVTLFDITVAGEASPPVLVDGAGAIGFATYGLPPPPAMETDPDGVWPDGEHCLTRRVAGVPSSTAGSCHSIRRT
jgi:prepilin-type N-terminal cleavage/methylation domain-containing protein